MVGAGCIAAAALLPAWLWMSGRVLGLPLFPVYAATFIGTYALPLLYEHPIVSLFPADNQLIGAFTVSGFLLLGTSTWYFAAHRSSPPISSCLLLNPVAADIFFLSALGGAIVFNLADNAGWLNIDPGVFTIIRAVTVALEALGCFTLAFRLGSGDLSGSKALFFKILLAGLILSELPTLLLIGPMAIVVITTLAYTLGARRFPWLAVVMSVLAFVFLHAGKGDMRGIYWEEDESNTQPQSYPAFFANWFRISVGNIAAGKSEKGEEEQTLLERASLMQLLLYEQVMTPNEVRTCMGTLTRLSLRY